MSRFKKLFEPTSIGTMELKNRMVMCPMCTGYSSLTGEVTERLIDYYAERAKGGVGLIIVEGTCIESLLGNARALPRLFVDSDFFIAGLSRLVERVHLYGAKIALQLQHHGRWATPLQIGMQSVAPSDCSGRVAAGARALTVEEIKDLEEAFAEGARRAKTAGFDAVKINGGGQLLVHEFLSPLVNKRKDEYGGHLEGRMRFVSEMIGRIQQKVGKDYPIIFGHPTDDVVEGGITFDEGKVIAQRLEQLGVAALRIHPAIRDNPKLRYLAIPPAAVSSSPDVHYAEETKKVLHSAKMMVGRRINDPVYANSILEQGKADLVVLGRPLIADPEFPRKAAEGRADEIRKCTACDHCWWCYTHLLPITCTVNPAAGEEKVFKILPARKSRKVLVIGSGPAGMEAARVATLRGHKVTLYEKDSRLGGQLNLASVPPHKGEVLNLMNYFINQLSKLKVKIELGKEATREVIRAEKPDAVILATGAKPLLPGIPGVEKDIVCSYDDILDGKKEAGNRVIVAGGGTIGCELAEFLASKGKQVKIIEQLPEVGIEMEEFTKQLLLERLEKYGVSILTNMKIAEITDRGAVAVNKEGKRHSLEADTVVICLGSLPYSGGLDGLENEVDFQVYSVADRVRPRTILEALREGWWASNQIA